MKKKLYLGAPVVERERNRKLPAGRALALVAALVLGQLLSACSAQGRSRTVVLEPRESAQAPFEVVGVLQPETEKEGVPLHYVGLLGESLVAVSGLEKKQRIVLVGKSGYLRPYTEEMEILPESVVCRGEHVLFEAKNGEDRVDIFLLNTQDESVRKIGSYIKDDLLAPIGWGDGDVSFLVQGISGLVLNRYCVRENTLERIEQVDALRGRFAQERQNATIKSVFFVGEKIVFELEIGAESQIVLVDLQDTANTGINVVQGSSAVSAGGKIYYLAEGGTLTSWDTSTGEKKEFRQSVSQFAVSSDGSRIAVVEKSESAYMLYVLEVQTGQALYVDIYQKLGEIYLSEDGSNLLVHSLQVEQTTQTAGYGGVYALYELGYEN